MVEKQETGQENPISSRSAIVPPPEVADVNNDDSHSFHSSIHEDEPERQNFVPKPVADGAK